MNNKLLRVDIVKPINKLLKEILGIIFLELSSLSDVGEKITTLAKFHNKANVFLCFERVVQSYNIRVITLLQNSNFLHHTLFSCFFIVQNLFLKCLDCHEMFSHFMACQVNLSKCSTSQNSSYPIEIARTTLHLIILLEIYRDSLLQINDIFFVLLHLHNH
jgi:hypothetical protein